MIATAAYYRMQRRGFSGGSPEQDWLEAEAELDGAKAGEAPDPTPADPDGPEHT